MNELQWTLLGVGVGLIVLVWGVNRLQEWRWHQMAKRTLGDARRDPLLAPEEGLQALSEEEIGAEESAALPVIPLEGLEDLAPTRHASVEEVDLDAEIALLRAEQSLAPSNPAPADAVPPTDAALPSDAEGGLVRTERLLPREELIAPPDEAIEYLVPLACTSPVTAREVLDTLARSSVTVRGTRWLGRRVTDGGWTVIVEESDQRFDSLRAALLLASRSGPIGELELERFCSMVSALATSMGLRVEFPPRTTALAEAQALDQFCAELDVVVGVNVVAATGQTLSGGRIARWAESHGMALMQDGAYHLLNAQGQSVWRLTNRDPRPFTPEGLFEMTLSGVTFLLDVPVVVEANRRLSPMVDAANQLARELGARVLDDKGQVLGPGQLGRIERELQKIVERMDEKDMPAGSSRARRLFSN